MLSPHFGSPSDAAAIAAFDASELRGHTILRPELTLATVVQRAAGYSHRRALGTLPARLQALERAAAELSAPPARRSYSHWVETFSSLLTSVGWAATARTDSLHFQLHRRWQSALDEFATLDFDGVTVSASTAIDTLARLLRSAIFAPESRNAPVQIIGPLELGGVPFDALWFLSAEDSTWPVRMPSNPLIPRFLERELHLPGADLTADHLAAALLTRRIARSAPQVVFSYGIESESGSHRPSPLLRELELTSLTHPPSSAPFPALPAEEFLDDQPIPPPAPAILKGGAVVLELQAACPFRAFAERRLFSAEPETREPGLDPRERGTVVHEVMQLFWSEVQSQRALKALTTSARDALLDSCIEVALHKPTRTAAGPWDTAYVQVERRRLSALLRPWLDEELRRPPFVVSASERKLSNVQIGPLHLDLRVDRIDQIGDPDESEAGTLDLPTAIIDYKTGTAATGQWLSERPEKPQLPLYAVAASPPPAGIAFAVLKAGKDRGLESFAVDRQIFGSSRSKDFETQLEDWNRVLTNLAEAFHQGDVTVDPRAYPKTCEHCSQRTLCRLDLSLVDDLAEEDERLAESDVSAE